MGSNAVTFRIFAVAACMLRAPRMGDRTSVDLSCTLICILEALVCHRDIDCKSLGKILIVRHLDRAVDLQDSDSAVLGAMGPQGSVQGSNTVAFFVYPFLVAFWICGMRILKMTDLPSLNLLTSSPAWLLSRLPVDCQNLAPLFRSWLFAQNFGELRALHPSTIVYLTDQVVVVASCLRAGCAQNVEKRVVHRPNPEQ
ncbi:hypothetical protein CC86DRAFT_59206 [Ophiobolus disseminans]|uniref:Uncharacterized protein n=1 Tax=Ophiobolus disseminans TaxID=1469910 RepID=A0A6A6ZSG9_9PLEO|nr:hypothetical protein CC86DRAFT_59206 [Ophiobolus disseminans]